MSRAKCSTKTTRNIIISPRQPISQVSMLYLDNSCMITTSITTTSFNGFFQDNRGKLAQEMYTILHFTGARDDAGGSGISWIIC